MPYKFDSIPINNPKHDRRVKLTVEDRKNIVEEYAKGGISQNGLAKKYNVSKRLVQFVLNPEKEKIVKKQFAERQLGGRYYDKDKHNDSMRKHRAYKKELYSKGLLGTNKEGIQDE